MNFERLKGNNPLVTQGQQSGSGIYLNGKNPYQKGGFAQLIKKGEVVLTRAELTGIKEVVIKEGCEQFKEGAMLHY